MTSSLNNSHTVLFDAFVLTCIDFIAALFSLVSARNRPAQSNVVALAHPWDRVQPPLVKDEHQSSSLACPKCLQKPCVGAVLTCID